MTITMTLLAHFPLPLPALQFVAIACAITRRIASCQKQSTTQAKRDPTAVSRIIPRIRLINLTELPEDAKDQIATQLEKTLIAHISRSINSMRLL